MTPFKFKWGKVHEERCGFEYVLIKVYVGGDPATYQWCGEFRLSSDEWEEMQKAIGNKEHVEFVEFIPTKYEIENRTES